jgi:hypothetical protein
MGSGHLRRRSSRRILLPHLRRTARPGTIGAARGVFAVTPASKAGRYESVQRRNHRIDATSGLVATHESTTPASLKRRLIAKLACCAPRSECLHNFRAPIPHTTTLAEVSSHGCRCAAPVTGSAAVARGSIAPFGGPADVRGDRRRSLRTNLAVPGRKGAARLGHKGMGVPQTKIAQH